ncbi:MAG: metallophosphoesterase [Oscillospiraceae bacterium]|nr:metallophosphoesterase [Oscillospiraceae bacterium]
MYQDSNFYLDADSNFSIKLKGHQPFSILQLTDLHLGFGPFSKKADGLALQAVSTLIKRAAPSLIILTGDSIFPFWPRSGTLDNKLQAKKLTDFLDTFEIPYAFVFGNHDVEMGAKASKQEIAQLLMQGNYSIFSCGPAQLNGVGNYIIKLVNEENVPLCALVMLDSGMYGDGWFFSGFDCIHSCQTAWCSTALRSLKSQNPALTAFAFFHMPLAQYKTAYEQMKLGNKDVTYHFGSIGEPNDYFGISKNDCDFFQTAEKDGILKGMFCGHDHYNTLSLTYHGIRLTYGMSVDYLGYSGIGKRYTQRGGTVLTIQSDGSFYIAPLPLTSVVSTFVRGKKSSDSGNVKETS